MAKKSTKAVTPADDSGTVIVSEVVKPVHLFNPETLEKVQVGAIRSRTYEGERVQRHEYLTSSQAEQYLTNPKGFNPAKVYSLGPTTTAFNFIDHAQAVQPLIDKGFSITKQLVGRGGLTTHIILEPPNPIILPDPITWDTTLWGDHDPGRQPIKESVMVTTSVKPGKAITYEHGWFRLICTNGLMDRILSLGYSKLSHTEWSLNSISKGLADIFKTRVDTVSGLMGPVVGNVSGASKLRDLMVRLSEASQTAEPDEDSDEEAEETTTQAAAVIGTLPLFARQAVSPFLRMPAWYLVSLIAQFGAMTDYYQAQKAAGSGSAPDSIYALDLINAITSPINLRTRDNPDEAQPLRLMLRQRPIIQSCVQLLGAFSLI